MNNPNFYLPLLSLDPRQATVLIELIQKDAYNQAIEDATKSAKLKYIEACSGNEGDEGEYDESYYVIDKESISNLKMK